jgi:hypothetical protein
MRKAHVADAVQEAPQMNLKQWWRDLNRPVVYSISVSATNGSTASITVLSGRTIQVSSSVKDTGMCELCGLRPAELSGWFPDGDGGECLLHICQSCAPDDNETGRT